MSIVDKLEYTTFRSVVQPPSVWKRIRDWWKGPSQTDAAEVEEDCKAYSPCDPDERVVVYRTILEDAASIYVFRNGTAVFSTNPMSEPEAIALLREEGPVVVGTDSADFHIAVIAEPIPGFIVRYANPSIISFEPDDAYPLDCPLPLAGNMIRLARHMDSRDLHVVARYHAGG